MFRAMAMVVLRSTSMLAIAVGVGRPQCAVGQNRGQQVAAAVRGPRFLLASSSPSTAPVEINVRRNAVLRKTVSLNFNHPTIGQILTAIERQTGLSFFYSRETLSSDRPIRLRADRITVAAALMEILVDADIDVLLSDGMQIALVKRGEFQPAWPHGSIIGRVTDTTGMAVEGAEAFLEHTRWRTATDTGGWYQLPGVDAGEYRLTVRRLGYAKQSRAITVTEDQTDTVDMVLTPIVTRLTELVSTATGRRRRVDVANDITTIDADSVMQTAPIRSVTELLETRVPGLVVQRTSGAPGDPSRLRLRGVSSPLRNNDPIVIVDGIRVYAEQSAARSANLAGIRDTANTSFNQLYAAPSPLDYIDPNSIETIEVIKGPSAATLYGQDAANGVIVITTKKGRVGPTRWTASGEYGRTSIEGDFPELFAGWGHPDDFAAPLFCPINRIWQATGNRTQSCQLDSLVHFQFLNDPTFTVLGPGHRSRASLSISGGSSALTYAVTGSYQQELGLPKLPDYEIERYQERLEATPPDWMRRPQHLTQWSVVNRIGARLGMAADLTLTMNFSRTEQQRSSLENGLSRFLRTYIDPASGLYYTAIAGVNGALDYGVGGDNITDGILEDYFSRVTAGATQFTNGASLNWRAWPWLTLTANAGLNVIQRTDEIFLPRGLAIDEDSVGILNDGRGTSVVSTVNVRGNVLAPIGLGMQFHVAVGANYTGNSISDQTLQTTELAPGTSLEGSVVKSAHRRIREDATFGWYVEPSLSHRRFTVTAGLRIDGGGSYGAGVTLPKFPKLGFSYLVSDESWFPGKDLFQSFRLRVSYGRASRQPGPEDRFRLYGVTEQVFAEGEFNTGVSLKTLGNTEVRPERSTEIEGGMDADLLDNRLNLSFTAYRKTTDDALLAVPVPPSVYGSGVKIVKNIGVVRNTGLNISADLYLLRSNFIHWSTQVGFDQNRNIVVALGPGVEPFYTSPSGVWTYGAGGGGLRVAPGYPLFGRWSQPIVGFADANGNGVLEPGEIIVGDTAVYVGSMSPNYQANFHTTVALWGRAVTINAGFSYQNGLSQRNEVWGQLRAFSRGWNDPMASLSEQLAVASVGTDYNWIQTISTVRFTSLNVGYRVPVHVARRLGVQDLTVMVQGGNLGLWSNYHGLDPNVNAFATGNGVTDSGILPQPRTWQIRINATY